MMTSSCSVHAATVPRVGLCGFSCSSGQVSPRWVALWQVDAGHRWQRIAIEPSPEPKSFPCSSSDLSVAGPGDGSATRSGKKAT